LKRDGEWLQPGCMLTPFCELILACDSWRSAEACAANLVLGVNPTTQLLARCSMLRPGGKGLDLGTGCGALALAAAPSAESVIGTDINGRSLGSNLKIQELSGYPPARTLYPNGQLQRETQYKMGLAHGWKEEWHPGGHIKQRTLYDLAVPIQEQEFYRKGNLIRQSKIDPQKAISIGAWWRSERMRSIDLCEFLPDMVARIQKKIRKGEPCGLS